MHGLSTGLKGWRIMLDQGHDTHSAVLTKARARGAKLGGYGRPVAGAVVVPRGARGGMLPRGLELG